MVKAPKKTKSDSNEVHVEVESWRWESPKRGFGWKQAFLIAVILAVAILFAFGFLIVAGVVLVIGIILNIVFFLLRKLT